jgi:hypothetical protein
MIAAFLALAMCLVWVAFVVLTVISVTSGETARVIALAIVTPFVLVFERFGFIGLDRLTSQG